MSKLNIQDKFLLAADGTLELNGNAVVDFNTSGRLMLGNQDWLSLGSHSTAHAEPDQEGTLSSVNHNYDLGGMHATGQAVNIIKTRIPVDGLSTYNVKVRVKKLKDADNAITTNSGAQITNRDTFYCGVISSDGNFNHIHADLASSYQYGTSNGERILSTGGHGNTDGVYTFEGSFSGFNATDEGDHNKFDPGTQYFDIVIICNYIGYYTNSAASFVENVKGQTVIESLEVQRGSTGSVGFEAEAGQFSYTGNQFNYYADPTVDLVSTGLSGSVEFINRGKTIDGEFKEGKGFQFWTNGGAGASEITFDAAGNVGIGTDTPGAKLEVGGTVMINNTLSNPGLWFGQGTANVRGYIGGGDYAVNGGADGDFGISGATDGSLLFGTTTSTGGTDHERMRITSLGKVGIGTSDPFATLDIRGTFAISNSTTSYWDFDRDDSDGSLKIADTGTERVRIDSGGNVGIGATNPSERLHVSGAAQFDSRNTSEQGQAGSIWYNTNVGDGVFQYVDKLGSTKAIGTGDITYNYTGNLWSGDPDQNNNINFITGKVGIGKVSPVHNLDSYTNEDSSYALYGKSDHINGGGILAWTPNLSSNKFVAYLEGSSTGAGLYVKGDGKVGVGSMSPSASLEILGKQSDDSIQLIETLSTGPGSLSLNRTYECLQEITGSSSVQKHSIIITANASSTFAFKIEIVKEATSTTAAGVISAGGHTASSKINKSQIGNSDWESTLSSAAQYYSLSPDDLEGIQADGKLTIPFYNKTGSTSKDTYYIKVEVLGSQSGDVTAVEFSPDVSFDFTNAFNFEIEV